MSGGPVTFLPENYAVSRTTGNISTEFEVSIRPYVLDLRTCTNWKDTEARRHRNSASNGEGCKTRSTHPWQASMRVSNTLLLQCVAVFHRNEATCIKRLWCLSRVSIQYIQSAILLLFGKSVHMSVRLSNAGTRGRRSHRSWGGGHDPHFSRQRGTG